MPYVHEQSILEANSQSVKTDGIKLIHKMDPKYQIYFGTKKLSAKVDCSHEMVCYGLGYLINYVCIHKKNVVMIFFPTPIDDEYIELHSVVIMKKVWTKAFTRMLGIKVIQNLELNIHQDIPIWENKIYRREPMLCDGDGPIIQYRRWASQFYCETLRSELTALK